MELSELMYDAFTSCFVSGGYINFVKQYSYDEIRMLYSKFSEDLLDYKIPHYRVVGIKYPSEYAKRSVLSLHSCYGMSLIELGEKGNLIIPSRLGGNNKSLGCFIGENDSEKEVLEFMRDAEKERLRVYSKHYESNQFGAVMHRCDDFDGNPTPDMCGQNIFYYQYTKEDMVKAELLVPDVYICRVQNTSFNMSPDTVFFYRKGTGILDYSDTTKIFTKESEIFPLRTVYDLSKVFVCSYPSGDANNALHLIYKMSVNERVLENILHEYGMEYGKQ